MSSSVTVPTGSQFSNSVSKSFVEDRSCATGVGGQIVSISCGMRRSQAECVGSPAKEIAGVGSSSVT